MKTSNSKKLYTLNSDVLERGDIILTTEKDRISNIIRFITLGPYSHVMLYLGGHSCSDAGGPGVRVASHNTQRIFFDSPNHCCVLRLKKKLSESEMDSIVDYARRMIGMEYSLPEATLTALRVKFSAIEINRQFCSRYVAQAYENGGISLVNNPDYCSPVNIYDNSNLLTEVESHLREATEEEIKEMTKKSIPLSAKDYADEYIFSNAKQISGYDIQTDEQFNGVLMSSPHLDSQFANLLKDSGHLDLWKLEKDENPWFYDFELLKETCPNIDSLRKMGRDNLPMEKELQRGWNITLTTLRKYYELSPLETFKLQIELHNTLLKLSKIRESIWLQSASL